MVHLPYRNHKNSIWKWSDFHLKKWLSPKKLKKSIKTAKIENSKKKQKTIPRYCIVEYVYQIW